jgi:hypothetical protein
MLLERISRVFCNFTLKRFFQDSEVDGDNIFLKKAIKVLFSLHIRKRKPGVDQIKSKGCPSALERAIFVRHHLIPILPSIPTLEVLVAREPLWDRKSLGIVALSKVEAQQRCVSGVEQVNA